MKYYAELNEKQSVKIAATLPVGLKGDDLDGATRDAMIDFGLALPTRDDDDSASANRMLDRCERNVKAIITAYHKLHR